MRDTLPNKKFFNSNEIASLLAIEPQEIRAWESEFPQIRSFKTAKGQRIYRREDVVLFASIKHLLKEKKLTVAGAQRVLAETDRHNFMPEDVSSDVANAMPEAHEAVLLQASAILTQDDFNDESHRLYEHVGQE